MNQEELLQIIRESAKDGRTTLDLSGRGLTELPLEIVQLTGLTELDLSRNRLTELPQEIGQLTGLTELDLGGNQLSALPAEIARLSSLAKLYLSRNQLTQLPQETGQLTALTELDLGGNQLSELPMEIVRLSNLIKLDLRDNLLTRLPLETVQLTGLTELDLGGNQLSELPVEIARLSNLIKLDLSDNLLTRLPLETVHLTGLTELDLGGNQLSELPVEIVRLSSLTKLDLRDNLLTQLPQEIVQLTGLTALYLGGNKLSALPPEIVQLASLTVLDLKDNPLVSPPLEVAGKGIEAIRSYLRDLDKESRLISELKVLLIGEGGAGKTSLTRLIQDKAFRKDELPTDGIRITGWQAKEVKVNIWDFGGQEAMHATHQFFLSKRSLYVLVLDGRRDERPEYWLRHIASFGGGSPVLIVLNKQDSNPSFDLNRTFLMRKYPSIRGFHPTSCARDEGIAEFRKSLLRELALVQMATTRWPNNWFQVKRRLEELREPCISWKRYEALCTESEITEAASQDVLVDFLHDLGVAIHFRDFELEDIHVLDPKWVTTAVYKIVTATEVAAAGGILQLGRLEEILRQRADEKYAYPIEHHKYLVGLMKKFELCFSVNKETVLIPQLLPVAEPDLGRFDLDGDSWLRFVLRYDDFLPPSVMPRFMVKSHGDIKDGLRWRTGAVLENKNFGAIAVVRSDNEDRHISICVAGTQRKDYLAVLLLFFREINDSFQKLRVSELVPMPDDPRCTANYKTLLTHAEKGKDEYIPDGSDKVYSVAELLGMVQFDERDVWQERVLDILLKMEGQLSDKESFAKKANRLLELKPNVCGLGVNLNELIDRLYDTWQDRRHGKKKDKDRQLDG